MNCNYSNSCSFTSYFTIPFYYSLNLISIVSQIIGSNVQWVSTMPFPHKKYSQQHIRVGIFSKCPAGWTSCVTIRRALTYRRFDSAIVLLRCGYCATCAHFATVRWFKTYCIQVVLISILLVDTYLYWT